MVRCQCCGYDTLLGKSREVCFLCRWHNEREIKNFNEDEVCANAPYTLNQARRNFKDHLIMGNIEDKEYAQTQYEIGIKNKIIKLYRELSGYADKTAIKRTKRKIQYYRKDIEKLDQCPCCKQYVIETRQSTDTCPVCHWEDDGQGDRDADEVWGGPNGNYSLSEARRNYIDHRNMYRPGDYGYAVKREVKEAKEELLAALEERQLRVIKKRRDELRGIIKEKIWICNHGYEY